MSDHNTPWKLDDEQQSFIFGADTTIVARIDDDGEVRFPGRYLSTILHHVRRVGELETLLRDREKALAGALDAITACRGIATRSM